MARDTYTKKKYIDVAYSLICKEDFSQINIRKIAAMTGFSVGNLYRHFSSLDELLLYATVLYFQDYFISAEKICQNAQDNIASIGSYIKYEQLFAHYSFYHPHLMYNLYFGNASNRTNYIIDDCMSIYFPDPESSSATMQKLSNHQSLEERYLDILQLFIYGNKKPCDVPLKLLNASIFYMYKGFLHEALTDTEYTAHAELRKKRYISCVEYQLELFSFHYPDNFPPLT